MADNIKTQNLIGIFSDSHGSNNILFANLDAGIAAGVNKFYNAGDTTPKMDKRLLIVDENFDEGAASLCRALNRGVKDFPDVAEDVLKNCSASVADLANILGSKYSSYIQAMISGNAEALIGAYMKQAGIGPTPAKSLETHVNYKEVPFSHSYKNGSRINEVEIGLADACIIGLPYVNPACVEELVHGAEKGNDNIADAKNILEYELLRVEAADPRVIIQIQHEHPRVECSEAVGKKKVVDNAEIYEMAMDFATEQVKSEKTRAEIYVVLYGHVGPQARVAHDIKVNSITVPTMHIKEGKEMLYVDTQSGIILPEGTFMR